MQPPLAPAACLGLLATHSRGVAKPKWLVIAGEQGQIDLRPKGQLTEPELIGVLHNKAAVHLETVT